MYQNLRIKKKDLDVLKQKILKVTIIHFDVTLIKT